MANVGNEFRAADAVYREGVYRTLAGIMAAVLLAVLGSWVAFGRDAVTTGEVKNLISLNSPYALDRTGIQSRLDQLTNDRERLDSEVIILSREDTKNQILIGTMQSQIIELQRRISVLENLENKEAHR